MENYLNRTYEEKKEIAALFTTWLKHYTHEVIVKVMERREEILANEFTMNLLRELKAREDKEHQEFINSMRFMLGNFDDAKEYDPHNHPLTHAGSYRDILYDMYIKDI